MNILEARKAAEEGKTVIAPWGASMTGHLFLSISHWEPEAVFGEWTLKPEPRKPVTLEDKVVADCNDRWAAKLAYIHKELFPLIGKRVKVTVKVIDE